MKKNHRISKLSTLMAVAILSIASLTAQAGNERSERVYTQLKSYDDVFSMSLSKKMIDFFDLDVDLNGKEKWIKGDFTEGKMLVISDAPDLKTLENLFESENYKMIDFGEEEENDVRLYVDRKGKKVSEAHFIVKGDENAIVLTIFGEITLEDKK